MFQRNVEPLWRYTECVFEIANEPNGDVNWNRDIKPYAEEVISEIRKQM
ncbi:cellulase family glycosylhydrolase [Bacillus atrophaeus]